MNTEYDSFRKDWTLNASYKLLRIQQRDERKFSEYFLPNLTKSIEYVVEQLEKSDAIINFTGLQELFHRKGINMRYEWLVYMKIQRSRMKAMVGIDILVRTLKKTMNILTSKKLRVYKKTWMGVYNTQKKQNIGDHSGVGGSFGVGIIGGNGAMKRDKLEDTNSEKMEFFFENYFKKLLASYTNFLIRIGNEVI